MPDVDRLMDMPVIGSALKSGTLVLREPAGSCRHVFTHRRWEMRVWWVDYLPEKEKTYDADGYKWLPVSLLDSLPVPEAFRKVLRMVGLEASR